MEALHMVDFFIQNVFRLHRLPISIILDQDARFCGHFWRHIFAKLNVTLNMSSGDHPQIDGCIKRVKQVLEDMLHAYVSD